MTDYTPTPGGYAPRSQPLGAPAAPVSPGAPQYPQFAPVQVAPPRNRTGLILGIILAAVVLLAGAGVAIGLVVRHGHQADPTQGAVKACETDVLRQLKAPATAKFVNERIEESGPAYQVFGDVDAENGFGALIRGHWTCATLKTTGGTWTGRATLLDND